jgi:hypothetical protein
MLFHCTFYRTTPYKLIPGRTVKSHCALKNDAKLISKKKGGNKKIKANIVIQLKICILQWDDEFLHL